MALRKKGYKLGLISNTHWRVLDPTRRELDRYFDVTTLSYEHGYVKPHPSIFLDTLKKLGVSADCCLHVGDDPIADIEGARKTGIRTAFIKRERKTANADICIRRLTDLVGLL
jgi:putative hydrolase of the HAD superfamily